MQSPLTGFTFWDGPVEGRPYWTYIGDCGGELDVSLHRAAARGDVAEISRLLEAGHNINARCQSEKSALNCAIIADKPEAVQLLLLRGADPNLLGHGGSDRGEGDDAVLYAAQLNRIEVMKVLIASGVGIHSYALGFAVSSRNMDMLRLLIETTSSDFADMPRLQAIERTLPTAIHTWSLEKVQYLMKELGYDATTVAANKQSVLNPALLAVFNQDDVHDQLMETEPGKDWSVAMQIIQLLVDAGASINAHEDIIPRTPLHFALQLQDPPPELVDYLLTQGADVNVPDWMGRTPFFQLLTRADATQEAVDCFKNLGGKLDVTDDDGNTPLHLVQNPRIASLLLASGASPATKNKHGETPLHQASRAGRIDVVSQLLDHGASIEAKDSSGKSPLLVAIASDGFRGSSEQIINYLLERGADIRAVDEAGESASQLADVKGYHINEAGKLEKKQVPQSTQAQDISSEEDMVFTW